MWLLGCPDSGIDSMGSHNHNPIPFVRGVTKTNIAMVRHYSMSSPKLPTQMKCMSEFSMKISNHKENKFTSVLLATINSGIDLLGSGRTHNSQSQD